MGEIMSGIRECPQEPARFGKRLTKGQRINLRDMFGGRCAYCGGMLGRRWHADHVQPVLRQDWLGQPAVAPENHRLDNFMPACAPCNISKGRMSLDVWRGWLAGHVRSLNQHHSIYRMVKAFGLVTETGDPVVFHFETVQGSGQNLADANSKSPAPSSQSERIAVLEAALRPFAKAAEHDIGSTETDADIFQQMGQYNRAPKITVGDMRRARSALAPLGEE